MNDADNQERALGTDEGGAQHSPQVVNTSGKKPYSAPVLKQQAHLRDITLAGSPGSGESSAPTTRRVGPNGSSGDGSPKSGSGDGADGGGGIFEDSIFGER